MPLSITSSLRMDATSATFFGLPSASSLWTNLRCNAVTAGADYPVSRLCTGRARA